MSTKIYVAEVSQYTCEKTKRKDAFLGVFSSLAGAMEAAETHRKLAMSKGVYAHRLCYSFQPVDLDRPRAMDWNDAVGEIDVLERKVSYKATEKGLVRL